MDGLCSSRAEAANVDWTEAVSPQWLLSWKIWGSAKSLVLRRWNVVIVEAEWLHMVSWFDVC